jgi:dTDP-4-amino-4,6-dideoxygalactose transaminase
VQVPFLDLKAHHDPIKEETGAAIQEVIAVNAFAGGPFVEKFEKDFAVFCDCQHAIGVGNGTDALWLVMLALGIGPGDEVVTVPNSFMATAEAISYTGAKPVFVDVDDATQLMNPKLLEQAITPKTKAIIPVHLYGQCADMDAILEIAKARKIPVIEDACQAHGATYKGRKAGSLGVAGCFSFYPGKNLGAFGEAGAVTTNDADLARRIQMFRDHGQAKKYYHAVIGWNARMDGIQGAVLRVKLKYLAKNNARRLAHAERYDKGFAGAGSLTPVRRADYGIPVYHLYVVRVRERERVMKDLGARGVGTAIHYPVPIHLQEAYASLGVKRGALPVSEQAADEIVSLPMFPELTEQQVETVIREVKAVAR